MGARVLHPAGVVWDWPPAIRGVTYALPAAAVATTNVSASLALAVGVLPAAITGTWPTRRGRVRTVVMGVLAGVPLFVGSLLAQVPWLAVVAILALCVGAAWLAAGRPLGQVALALCLPMVGVGLSYTDLAESATLAGLLIVGSVYAYLVSLPWPEYPAPTSAMPPAPPVRFMLAYGVRLGAAAAAAAAIGFVFNFDHVGWACAAVLLVMRPSAQTQEWRSVDRVVSVVIGAAAAVGMILADPAPVVLGLAAGVAIAAATATQRSRWYVTGLFTTFIVFLLLLASDPQDAGGRFFERLGETLLGVGLAFLIGVVLPMLWRRQPKGADAT